MGDEYRRRSRTRTSLLPIELGPDPELAADVRLVLADLPEEQREVLELTYWDGLTADEVASVLGTTRSAVWMRLHRARRAFAKVWHPASRSGGTRIREEPTSS